MPQLHNLGRQQSVPVSLLNIEILPLVMFTIELALIVARHIQIPEAAKSIKTITLRILKEVGRKSISATNVNIVGNFNMKETLRERLVYPIRSVEY